MSAKAIKHETKNGRTIVTIEETSLFGFIKTEKQFISSNDTYQISDDEYVWYTYPDFKVIGCFSNYYKLLSAYQRKIEFENN